MTVHYKLLQLLVWFTVALKGRTQRRRHDAAPLFKSPA